MKLYRVIFKKGDEIIDTHHFLANSAADLQANVTLYANRYIKEPKNVTAYVEKEG